MTEDIPRFEQTHPHLKEFKCFLDELNKETERGAALIAAAMIDDLLRRCIVSFLVEHADTKLLLEGFNAPLGNLSARVLGAFAMGLISEPEYLECQIIRKIRNIFAHDIHVSFKNQQIHDLCSNMNMCAGDYGDVHVNARGRFTTSAVGLALNLTNRPHYASLKRLRYGNWEY